MNDIKYLIIFCVKFIMFFDSLSWNSIILFAERIVHKVVVLRTLYSDVAKSDFIIPLNRRIFLLFQINNRTFFFFFLNYLIFQTIKLEGQENFNRMDTNVNVAKPDWPLFIFLIFPIFQWCRAMCFLSTLSVKEFVPIGWLSFKSNKIADLHNGMIMLLKPLHWFCHPHC